jgi:CheY-like chemotaxis protein
MSLQERGESGFMLCHGCGENVQTHTVAAEGRVERRCVYCGLVLDAATPIAETFDTAIAVDDSPLLCGVLEDLLVERGLARSVKVCRDGSEFLTVLTQALLAHRTPGFLVLDVQMPIINGIHAALAARALEKGFGTSPIPIIFFSVKKCDENFRKVLKFCAPASYLNKATAPTPELIGERLSAIVRQTSAKSR